MEQHFMNYQINHEVQEKYRENIIAKNWEKGKEKTDKKFRKNSSRLARVLSTIRAGKAREVEDMFTRKLTRNQVHLEILVPYPNNPSEEAIFGSNRIMVQHDTMKL